MNIGLASNPSHRLHDTGIHVENARRIDETVSFLRNQDFYNSLYPISERAATYKELLGIHSAEYINFIRSLSTAGGGEIDSDTLTAPGSFEAAIKAAGTVINTVEAVLSNRVDQAMALVRPPGHHATQDNAMGFCLFNNIAIAAKYALNKYHLGRIAIIDIDVHHGNGTQSAFYSDPEILYISTHQYPLFPGTGSILETGEGPGKGTTLNIPLPPGCGDPEFMMAYDRVIIPAIRRFKPQLILVSAGYDTHWLEDLAGMYTTVTGIIGMLKIIRELAAEYCQNRLALVLEGGYPVKVLQNGVAATFQLLIGRTPVDTLGTAPYSSRTEDIESLLHTICQIHNLYESTPIRQSVL